MGVTNTPRLLPDKSIKMAPIDVYGMNLSAPCRIVNMTAECLGIEYNFKIVDLMAGEHMKPEFLALNPMHNIPTMADGDFVMNESRAIAAYLVNKYGKDDKLYPKDPEVMFGGDKPGQDKFDKLKEVLDWLDGFVKDGKFSAGNDDLTIGDLSLLATYSTMKAAELADVDLSQYSNAEAWFEKCVKLVPNYEKVNGEGCAAFGGYYKSKASA